MFENLTESFSRLISQYRELQQQSYFYRVTDIQPDIKRNHTLIVIQLVGKSVRMKLPACEVAGDEAMLRGFSPLDIRTITFYATKDKLAVEQPQRMPKYRIVTSLEDYHQTKKLQLALLDQLDKPLPAMTIKAIKESTETIQAMCPEDVNSINDLYYLSQDDIVDIRVSEGQILTTRRDGHTEVMDVAETPDFNAIQSVRLSYMLGYVQAENLVKAAHFNQPRYAILSDNISTLYVKDMVTDQVLVKHPQEVLSSDYNGYSKSDIAKIGYICGQLASVRPD
ncbi:MAG: hypothetical protein AAGB12_15585 [Pseudomonadota bacterium]